jgi:hypothetical protein
MVLSSERVLLESRRWVNRDLANPNGRFSASTFAKRRLIESAGHADQPCGGPHAFDLLDDSATSRRIIRQVLDFLTAQLTPSDCPD